MLNDTPNVMTELEPKGPRFVEIIEIIDRPDTPFLMESLFKESYWCDNSYIVSLKPNDKSTFPVLDTTQTFFISHIFE